MYKCDFKIMGIPKRMASIVRECSLLGLTMDDVYLDTKNSRNPLKTSRGAFCLPYENDVTHRCVLQDDVEFSDDFKDFCNMLINKYPDAIFTLYTIGSRYESFEYGSIFKTKAILGGQAVIIPLKYLNDIYAELDRDFPNFPDDDRWYCYYAHHHRIDVMGTVPSCVQTYTLKEGIGSGMGHPAVSKCKCFEKKVMHYNWRYTDRLYGRVREFNTPDERI